MLATTSTLGIHHVSAVETDPATFVELAARAGCTEVSLFAQQPNPDARFPLLTRDNSATVAARLKDTGLRLANVDVFLLTPGTDPAAFEPALALGAELGARGAVALLFDDDETRVLDNLGALAATGGSLGLQVFVEMLAMSPAWNTLAGAAELVQHAAQPNVSMGLDILHVIRSGGGISDVESLDPALVGYAQLCDGANLAPSTDYGAEAVGNRVTPGEGIFPLAPFLQALPANIPLELEVPQPQDAPPADRVQRIVAGMRGVMAKV
jgi:sugar phosphate isomerase/epimerase